MGNQHSTSNISLKPRKNVHWKSAGRPAIPAKPEIIPLLSDDEPNAVTLRWMPPVHDGGAPLQGYQVECNRLGTPAWIRTAPPVVVRPELVLSGLEPPHRYQFRVAAINGVGRSDYSELSDVLTVSSERGVTEPPTFLLHLNDVTALENEKTEFRVKFSGVPAPTVAWFKDGYEIFSSRRTAITTDETTSVLLFHQTLASDEGEIKCTVTNRAGHAVTKAHLYLEAAPRLRYPRQYEDGLLYEINETVFLKTSIVGNPTPTLEWRHDGNPVIPNERIEITNAPKFSILKILSSRRSDRGEYQIHARNSIGEDTASFLVTITAPPDPPRHVSVTRQVDKSVTLDWHPPEDDGGCRIGNYIVEYYRSGWNVWLKAVTCRKTNVTLFDLIEGSEYRFRVKAESPYGVSAPSTESSPVKIPGRAVDMEFLAVESRIINDVLLREDGEEPAISPVPRRKRAQNHQLEPTRAASDNNIKTQTGSNEFMLVLYPDVHQSADNKADKRKSFQLDLEDAMSPPQLSLSAPDLSSRCILPFKALRNSVSSTELLHERAMARFYKVVAMKEEKTQNEKKNSSAMQNAITSKNIPTRNVTVGNDSNKPSIVKKDIKVDPNSFKTPQIIIKSDSIEESTNGNVRRTSEDMQDSQVMDHKWQNMSFDEDYTASTVSTDGEYSDDGSLNGDSSRHDVRWNEENTYNPRDKTVKPSSPEDFNTDDSDKEFIKKGPLPDPNFVPKPILKRRDSGQNQIEPTVEAKINPIETKKQEPQPRKEEKMTILKKITKMPVQKPFSFTKKFKKERPSPLPEKEIEKELPKTNIEKPKTEDTVHDEGKTVIDYYSNIVKEYGKQRKPTTQLYLKTEELKSVAEKQQKETTSNNIIKKQPPNKIRKRAPAKTKQMNATVSNSKTETKVISDPKNKPKSIQNTENSPLDKTAQKIILKTAERATIVIPIDYKQLEENAKVNVRSAIDYMVDVCLLLLAFWVYFFKDERLAIPFLILIIYRQLQETLFFNIPEWVRRHTPAWLKKPF